ncbi:S-layer homology domain-containing protein [Paenibacillus abyssi]|uniref:SLH domain-containing protein n=1 Tax=Paenibacillus abyssi TaxID=1340531 RepID=A0A917FYF8_9BACL|nr:S-layer homology domain-containing protein [Paenibacillus abyssi]GGG14148.1 hypothetical protein GCM10010916_33810 [Paenibacillus abyssi]
MIKQFVRPISAFLVFILIVSLLPPFTAGVSAEDIVSDNGATVQSTVTESVYLVSQDSTQKLEMNYINTAIDTTTTDYAALFTSGANVTNTVYNDEVLVKQYDVAIQVDAYGNVLEAYGPDADPPTEWAVDQNVKIPPGGYVVLAGDSSWDTSTHRKPLFLHYQKGHSVSLEKGGMPVTAVDYLNPKPGLTVNTPSGTTVTSPVFSMNGYVTNYADEIGLRLTVNQQAANITANGSFMPTVFLAPGANTLTLELWIGHKQVATTAITVTYDNSGQSGDYIEVEAAPKDISIGVSGPRQKIDVIDKDVTGIPNVIALFTRDYGNTIIVPQFNVAVQVDANNQVLSVVNPSIDGKTPNWAGPTVLEIPEGGYVLYAQDTSYANNNIKRFLATSFKVNDIIKLRKNNEVVSIKDLMSGNGLIARLALNNNSFYTVTSNQTVISGMILNIDDLNALSLTLNNTAVSIAADGTFSHMYPLSNGTNYVDVKLTKNGIEQDVRHLVIFSRPGFSPQKEVILWVDQAANARKFQTSEQVYDFLKKAKDSGVTDIAIDVKGVEGFASYKKSDLTGRPYISEIKTPSRAGSNPNLDLLEEFVKHGHALGMKIHAAINVFAEGSIANNEFAVLDQHLDWEERVYYAENNGEIKRLRESARKGLVAFVNPANDGVRDYQLKTFEEIIKNYNVDGVIHDRGRYDNEGADFSNETRVKFEAFLQARNKTLQNWPTDIYSYVNNVRVDGPLINDWWEFRSATIKSFFGEVKQLVDSYEVSTGRIIQVSSYVGSWFETYYLNGVHWGSTNFRYDARLGLNNEAVYTPGYYQTGYIEYLDFLMIGAYQTTAREIEKYITLGNVVTNGEIPLYAGIALNNVQTPAMQREVFQAGLNTTNGLMLFDASQINWPIAAAALRDELYVKDYQLGMSLPGNPDSFLEGNYYNVNLVEDNLNVMTDAFAYSTGTNRFGVEVVVDAAGNVTRVANRNQAINWSWGAPEENNSVIPQGGFVISTLDRSGTRTLRQLVANAYNIGDQARAAVLSGLLDDEGRETSSGSYSLQGQIEVLGPGQASVLVNGEPAAVDARGVFTANVPLSMGKNTVTVDVIVDGLKTNSKTVEITRIESSGGYIPPVTPVTPPEPEREIIRTEIGEDGRLSTVVDVDLDRMLEEIEQLLAASTKVLTYSVEDTGDGLTLNLPVSGISKAAELLTDGTIVIETPLGNLDIPIRVLQDAISEDMEASILEVRIAKTNAEQEDEAGGSLSAEGASKIGEMFEIGLVLQDGGTVRELAQLSGGYLTFTLPNPLYVDPARTTALSYDADTGELAFVPAIFTAGDEGYQAELMLADGGMFIIAAAHKTFADLSGHWANDDVSLLASKWLVDGMSESRFAPNEPLTRAQFAALLVRSLGLKEQSQIPVFNDVNAGDWFAGAVGTAADKGLIQGFGNGDFRPDEEITREQISVMLLRAMNIAGAESSDTSLDDALQGFGDRDTIASWSEEAVSLIVESGLMEGRPNNSFDPQASTTRAEGVVVLKRLLQLAGFMN